jgi:uncharacterized protein (TIGR03435 family)
VGLGQISGGPSWMNADRFDIEAKAARPRTRDELHVMLQHLLEERFHLLVLDKAAPTCRRGYFPLLL